MAFPDDLSDVVAFKIHPAIGIARLSTNDDYFVFGTAPSSYKSNGLMKRQAVQFRIFAYGADQIGLGELTPSLMTRLNLSAVWSAEVANRKLEYTGRQAGLPDAPQRAFGASAASDDAQQGRLTASLPAFAEGGTIPLGQITDTGLFIPPKAGVHRETPGTPVPNFPRHTPRIADTTSDGIVSVTLNGAGNIPVLSAWIVVAPQDFSPDVDPEPLESRSLLVLLKNRIASNTGSAGNLHNQTARRIDEMALQPATGRFAPGFEVSFGSRSSINDIRTIFYSSATDPLIDSREIRVRPRGRAGADGAVPGLLTSGLCSPWQTDFTACTGYWTEYLPEEVYLDEAENIQVNAYRYSYADQDPLTEDRLTNGDDYVLHQDKVGVIRLINGKPVETERGPEDDIS